MVKLGFRLINCYIAVLLKNREQSQLTGKLSLLTGYSTGILKNIHTYIPIYFLAQVIDQINLTEILHQEMIQYTTFHDSF